MIWRSGFPKCAPAPGAQDATTLADKAKKCALYDFDSVEMVECKWALWQDIISALDALAHSRPHHSPTKKTGE